MKVIRSLVIAFSMYSKIPVPQFAWEEEDMKYVLCFLPFVGTVVGGFFYLTMRFAAAGSFGPVFTVCLGAVIPLLLTGGIHVDGYMDTMDAFHSYQSKERKLEILKDPHIGAFSVIMLLCYYLLYLGFLSEIKDEKDILMVALGFVLSRIMGGFGVVFLKPSKKDGLLKIFSDTASKKIVAVVLGIEFLVCAILFLRISPLTGGLVLLFTVGIFRYCKNRCYREFGGVSGDSAGYLIEMVELTILIVVAVCGKWI